MTLALVSPNSSFEASNVGFVPPISDASLRLWHFFGALAGPLGKNLVVGGPDSTVIGNPVKADRYVLFTGNVNYLQTQISQTPDFTLVLVARSGDSFISGDSNRPFFVSNYQNQRAGDTVNSIGLSLYVPSPGSTGSAPSANLSAQAATYSGAAGAASQVCAAGVNVADLSQWHCLVFTKSGGLRTIYDKTANKQSTASTPAGQIDDISSGTFRIGSDYGTSGHSDMAMVGVYNRGLTATEVQATYAFLQAFYAKRGIAI